MNAPSDKQCKQRSLSWMLRMVMGAHGTLNPWRDRKYLSKETFGSLIAIREELKIVEQELKTSLRNIK